MALKKIRYWDHSKKISSSSRAFSKNLSNKITYKSLTPSDDYSEAEVCELIDRVNKFENLQIEMD